MGAHLREQVPPYVDHSERREAQPTRLVMGEFALFKGHRYAMVVLDADSRQMLWVGEGRRIRFFNVIDDYDR